MANQTNHTQYDGQKLTLDCGKHLTLSGVVSVDGFSDEKIFLSSDRGRVFITGNAIKITSYNKNTGLLTAEGDFSGIRYGEKKGSFLKRLFS